MARLPKRWLAKAGTALAEPRTSSRDTKRFRVGGDSAWSSLRGRNFSRGARTSGPAGVRKRDGCRSDTREPTTSAELFLQKLQTGQGSAKTEGKGVFARARSTPCWGGNAEHGGSGGGHAFPSGRQFRKVWLNKNDRSRRFAHLGGGREGRYGPEAVSPSAAYRLRRGFRRRRPFAFVSWQGT